MDDPVGFVAALVLLGGIVVFLFRGTQWTCHGVNKGLRAANKWADKQLDEKD